MEVGEILQLADFGIYTGFVAHRAFSKQRESLTRSDSLANRNAERIFGVAWIDWLNKQHGARSSGRRCDDGRQKEHRQADRIGAAQW